MWKHLNESQQGTSHQQTDTVCQDASLVTPYADKSNGDELLILACADGAGSAKQAHVGAKDACEEMVRCAASYFDNLQQLNEVTEATLRDWMRDVHQILVKKANELDIAVRDLACTLLFGVVGRERAAFIQIGDGAIVILEDNNYRPIFWPQSGEYQNTTFFVTDEQYEHRCQCLIVEKPISELAMLTDGLQMLALNYSDKTAHDPFFRPMFMALRAAPDKDDLHVPLQEFLKSKDVNARTDDDKTLILATRVTTANAPV
jgi:hypothetical protein